MENQEKIIQAIRQLSVQTGSLACLGCGHEHNCGIHGCVIINEAIEKLGSSGWISVQEGLPDAEQEVFIYCNRNGYKFTTTAMYEDGTVFTEESEWNWYDIDFEYDEENDKYLIPKGWWEHRNFNSDDVYNNMVDCEVTHWMPLPEPPEV